jgi:23S rRNA pseudouridine1911/1915/1917 synthase
MSERATGTPHAFTCEANSDVRLDALVASRCGLSRTQAATLIANGHVHVQGRREKAAYRPVAGEHVEVFVPPPAPRDIVGEAIPLAVVFEDDDVVVVDKPAGMVVHPAPGNWSGTLVNALVGRGGPLSAVGGNERPGLVHRLDKDTSGLLLVAKSDRAHQRLSAALAERRITRRYAALIWGHLKADEQMVDRPLARDPNDRQRMSVVASGKPARTTFTRLARLDAGDLLRAHLHTGRTHQIRVHLTHLGHPLLGDPVYRGRTPGTTLPFHRQALHAVRLGLVHPASGEFMEWEAPPPADFADLLKALERSDAS